MILQDLHMHTVFSDGKNTPEEMVLEAVRRGFHTVGISDHSSGDPCGMTLAESVNYRAEIARLKDKYTGKIRVLCGLERDFLTDDFADYDYTIGSVHWLPMPDGHRVSIDWTPEKLREGAAKYFSGDMIALAEAYYEAVSRVVKVTKCDIIGHFDLVSKFVEKDPSFDPQDPRYVKAWKRAADQLLRAGKPFEINTGAISRGYRTDPYPSAEIRRYIRDHGGTLILSSDAHQKENIGYRFDQYAEETSAAAETFLPFR